MKKAPKDVDTYIIESPKELQDKLKELRAAIRTTVPDAEEHISYRMPYYSYKGRLAYFAAYKNHIGLYVPPPVIKENKNKLKNYETSTGTIRFPNDKPLPIALIKKLIKSRMKINEARKRK
jgi:uncharacterized protein YdhG (YjbR/CyaY superfamily)